jgi:putative addiction module killer protein
MGEEIYKIQVYVDEKGEKPFLEWLESLHDVTTRAKIKARLSRIRLGNQGDTKSLGGSLYEIRVDEGQGYRLYFTQEQDTKIILWGGSKKTQSKDIVKAKQYLKDYRS